MHKQLLRLEKGLSTDALKQLLQLLLLMLALLALVPVGATLGGFFDSESSLANSFSAGVWDSQPVQIDAPLVLSLSAPESFAVEEASAAEPPPEPLPNELTDEPVEVSEAVTTVTSAQTPSDETPAE